MDSRSQKRTIMVFRTVIYRYPVSITWYTWCYDTTTITMVSYSALKTYDKYLILEFQTYVKYLAVEVKRRVQLVKRISIFLPNFCKFYKMQLEVQILAQPV